MNKKAQTEDLFADLPIAIVIIVIAAIILHLSNVKIEEKAFVKVSRTTDLISFLKTPVNEQDFIKRFSKDDWKEDMTIADAILQAPLYEKKDGYSDWEKYLIGNPSFIFKDIGDYNLKITYPDGNEKIFGFSESEIKKELLGKVSEAGVLLPSREGAIKIRLNIFGDVNYE